MRLPFRFENIPEAVRNIINALSGNITFLENVQCKIMSVTADPVANTTFTVNHNLGVVPTGYIANLDRDAHVYDVARSTWTDREIYLRCTAANAVVTLIVFY